MSTIDTNNRSVALAVTDDANETPTPLLVDPVTNELLISIAAIYTPSNTLRDAKFDSNNNESATAVTSDTGAITGLLCTDEGYLLIQP